MEFETTTQMDDLLEKAANLRTINTLLPTAVTIKRVTDFAKELEFDEDDIQSFLEEEGGLVKLVAFLADTAEVTVIQFMMRQK